MEKSSETNAHPILPGGQMGEVIRNYNWSTSPLGTPENWPRNLHTLTQMMLSCPSPMLICWGPEFITFYNDAFLSIMGGKAANGAMLGQRAELNWSDAWFDINPLLQKVLTGGSVSKEHEKLVFSTGGDSDNIYWNYSLSPLYDDSGAIGGVLVNCAAPAPEAQTAGQLLQSEQRFQNLVREASLGIIVLMGPEMRIEIVNDAYARLIGRRATDLYGKNIFDLIPEARDPFSGLIDQVRSTGQPLYLYSEPYSVQSAGGQKEGYLDLVYQPYKEPDGTITGVIILCQDVTQQVRARQELEASEARLRSLVESAPFPIGVYTGPEMVIQLVNQSIIDVWGKGSDIVGKRYSEVLPELADKGIYEQLDQVYRTGKAYYAHNQRVDLMIGGELKQFYFKYTFTPLFDSSGHVYGVMNTAADVTDLVLAQQQLEEAQTSLKGAIELANLGAWELDLLTGKLNYSGSIKSWFSFEREEALLEDVFNPIHPDDRELVAEAIRQALEPGSTGIYDAEYRMSPTLDSPERVLHALGKVLYDTEGKAYKLIGTAQDVTHERQRQQALEWLVERRTEELAAANEELAAQNEEYQAINEELEDANQQLFRSNENLQQFAYVASHDLQEPLRKILQFGDVLKTRYVAQSGEAVTYLERMQAAASRMSVLIRDLLDFSGISANRRVHQPVSLNGVVDAVLADLELVIAESDAHIDIETLPVVTGDAMQLGQLFQNLLTNALKFRQPNLPPVIRLRASVLHFDELPPTIKPARNADHYHQIDIIDNGIGFDEKYIDRIFQVFQRLHGRSEFSGTGIGLAICEKVISNHGGAITASSQPGKGAAFKIYIPV